MMGNKPPRKKTKLDDVDTFDGNRPQDGLTFTDSPSQDSGDAASGDAMRQLLMLLLGQDQGV